jgi:hypothetical protein
VLHRGTVGENLVVVRKSPAKMILRKDVAEAMRKIVLVTLVLVSMSVGAQAATISVGPSDCSAATVNAAISSSKDGDTILLTCAGSTTWTATVTIPATKGITLQVQGATNTPKTSASFPLVITSNQSPAIDMEIGSNHSVTRVSGFRFAPNSGSADPFLKIGGQGTGTNGVGGFRLDNNYFDTISAVENVAVWSNGGNLFGVIDNNTFHNVYRASDTAYGPYNIQVWNYWHPSGANQCWGCDGWTNNDFAYGSARFTFVEDNLFEQTTSAPAHMRHYVSAELGGRYVSRHNTFSNNYPDQNADLHDAHGLCLVSSNGAGNRGGEIYDNTITGTGYDRGAQLRGGSWLVYDNVITAGGGNPIEFDEYRAEGASACESTDNLAPIMPPWPVPAGANWSAKAAWIPYVTDGSAYPLPQQIFNTFVWNNKGPDGVLINPAVPTGTLEQTYIQNNRDYFASASQPAGLSGYTPFTYPHPLRSGGSAPPAGPAAPTGLAAVVN